MGKKSDKEILKDIFNKIWDRYAGNMKDGYSIQIDVDESRNSVDITVWKKSGMATDIDSSYTIYANLIKWEYKSYEDEMKVVIKEIDNFKK